MEKNHFEVRYLKKYSSTQIVSNTYFISIFSACVPDKEQESGNYNPETVPHKGDHTGNEKNQNFSSLQDNLDYHKQDTNVLNCDNTLNTDGIKRYKAHKSFGDRRQTVTGARTYFYQNEAQCEKNMETFLRCIEAVAGNNSYSFVNRPFTRKALCLIKNSNKYF